MHWGCVGVYNGYRLVRADFVVFPLSGEVIRLQHHHNRATYYIMYFNFFLLTFFVKLIFFLSYIWTA